ncbi:MAG: hypothetical protein V3T83_20095 [Acidobacteriota bacterium]
MTRPTDSRSQDQEAGSGLRLIDASSPGGLTSGRFIPLRGACGRLRVSGNHAYIADRRNGLRVVSAF